MRTALLVMICCLWMTVAWAKTVKIPKGSIDPNQLHDELLARFPAWHGTQRPDGIFINPSLRIEYTDQEIRLDVPDNADEAAIQAIIAAHIPGKRRAKDDGREAATMTMQERVADIEARLGID